MVRVTKYVMGLRWHHVISEISQITNLLAFNRDIPIVLCTETLAGLQLDVTYPAVVKNILRGQTPLTGRILLPVGFLQ